MGMKIVLADIARRSPRRCLPRRRSAIAGDDAVLAVASTLSKPDEVDRLADQAFARLRRGLAV